MSLDWVSALCTQAVSLKMHKSKPSLKQGMLVDVVYALIYFKHPNEGKLFQSASIVRR